MGLKEKCTICGKPFDKPYIPMKEWKIAGRLCGKCYSKKIFEHYPGTHARMTDE